MALFALVSTATLAQFGREDTPRQTEEPYVIEVVVDRLMIKPGMERRL